MSRKRAEDRLIAGLSQAMRTKLRLNRHKSTWSRMPVEDLIGLLKREVKELEDACANAKTDRHLLDLVRMEAADVANFAGMIADNADVDAGFGRGFSYRDFE